MSLATNSSKRFFVNVTLPVKPDRRDDFLSAIAPIIDGTKSEPGCLSFTWGENVNIPNTFHIQEQLVSAEAFKAHTETSHMMAWSKFVGESGAFSGAVEVDLFEGA